MEDFEEVSVENLLKRVVSPPVNPVKAVEQFDIMTGLLQ